MTVPQRVQAVVNVYARIPSNSDSIAPGINNDRRDIEAGMREQAFAYVDSLSETGLPPCVCVYEPAWHQGIVGLIQDHWRKRPHG